MHIWNRMTACRCKVGRPLHVLIYWHVCSEDGEYGTRLWYLVAKNGVKPFGQLGYFLNIYQDLHGVFSSCDVFLTPSLP